MAAHFARRHDMMRRSHSVHSESAVKNDVTKGEIAEALGVAIAMNIGAALVYSVRALDAADAVK